MRLLLENTEIQLPVEDGRRAIYDLFYPIFGGTQGRWMVGDSEYLLPLPDSTPGVEVSYVSSQTLTELEPDKIPTTTQILKAWRDTYIKQLDKVGVDTEANVQIRNVTVTYYLAPQGVGTDFYLLLPTDRVEVELVGVEYDFTSLPRNGVFFFSLPSVAAKTVSFYKDYAYELDVADLRQFIKTPKVILRTRDVRFRLQGRQGMTTFLETRFFTYPQPTAIGSLLNLVFPSPCEANSHFLTPDQKSLFNVLSTGDLTTFREVEVAYLLTKCFTKFLVSDSPIAPSNSLFLIGAIPVSGEWDLSGVRAGYFDLIPYLSVPFTNPDSPSFALPYDPIAGRFLAQLVNADLMVAGLLRTLGVYLSKEAVPLSVDFNHTAKPLYYGGFLKVLRDNIPTPEGVVYIGESPALYNLLKLTTAPIFPYKLKEKPKIDPFPFVGISDIFTIGTPGLLNIDLPNELTLSSRVPQIVIPVSELQDVPEDWPVFVINSEGRPDLVPRSKVSMYSEVIGAYAEDLNGASPIILGV